TVLPQVPDRRHVPPAVAAVGAEPAVLADREEVVDLLGGEGVLLRGGRLALRVRAHLCRPFSWRARPYRARLRGCASDRIRRPRSSNRREDRWTTAAPASTSSSTPTPSCAATPRRSSPTSRRSCAPRRLSSPRACRIPSRPPRS